MDDDDIEILGMTSRIWGKQTTTENVSSSSMNKSKKRRRPTTPVAITSSKNCTLKNNSFEYCQENIVGIKNEPGIITIVPKENNTNGIDGNDDVYTDRKIVNKIDHYEILEPFIKNTGEDNSKRIKLCTEEEEDDNLPIHYVIVHKQNENDSTKILEENLIVADNIEKFSNQQNSNSNEYAIVKSDLSNDDEKGVLDKRNCHTFDGDPMKLEFVNNEQILGDKNDKETIIYDDVAERVDNDSLKLNSSNTVSLDSFEALKSRPQKPIVIMQQLISPSNRTSLVKTKRRLNNTESLNATVETTQPTPSSKFNENYNNYETKRIEDSLRRSVNNYEQDNDEFLLKKEFPIISSSQVDSVLKAIDMQGLGRGILPANETQNNNAKREKIDKEGRSLPGVEGAAKSSFIGNNVNESLTNRPSKRFGDDKSVQNNYSKAVEKLTVTLQCYKCKDCSYMSLNEKQIFEHVKKDHSNLLENDESDKPMLKCPGCSNTFRHKASLLSHIVHDHQVHESEAEIMADQLSLRNKSSALMDNIEKPKPTSQIRITKTDNEQIYITQTPNALFKDIDERSQSVSPALPSPVPSQSDFVENDRIDLDNGGVQSISNINTIPVVMSDSNLGRKFEFINFKSDNDDGDDYLREEDLAEKNPSDSDTEFANPSIAELIPTNSSQRDNESLKVERKPRPKERTRNSNKQHQMNLKQGFKCEIEDCAVRMLVQENITYHQKCHVKLTPGESLSFQCPECLEFKTNNWNNLAGHLWRAHIVDMELHSCDLCSFKTPSLSNLANQHRGIHGDDRPFLCDNCGKGFKTTKQLRNHRALHRAKDKEPMKCDKCKRNFANTRLLKLHRDSVHRVTKPFTCNACSYSASTRSALKLHLRRHTGEKPFACDQCSYSTGDHNSLRRHKQRHLGLKPYSCPHCSYGCIQASTYKVHLKKKHPGLDHDLMFSCQYCSYKSLKKENLLTHLAKHDGTSDKNSGGLESPIPI